MDEFNDDEIIDLEEEFLEEEFDESNLDDEELVDTSIEAPNVSNIQLNNKKTNNVLNAARKPETIKNAFNGAKNPNMMKNAFNKDKTTQDKLNNLGNKNRSFPPLGGASNFHSEEENDNTVKNKVTKKAGGAAVTAATGGALHGKAAEEVAGVATKALKKVWNIYKKKLIIGAAIIGAILLILVVIFSGAADDSGMGKATHGYMTGEMTEDELLDQLIYYGYCNDKTDCKKKGVYRFYQKVKTVYDEYKQACGTTVENDKPCGVTINTGLIIETINYYRDASGSFDFFSGDNDEEDANIFSKIGNYFERKRQMNDMLDDVEKLALAQAEFVEESCGSTKKKFYQISFNKYISYLKYGDTSSHPNYDGKPLMIENDTCQGPKNDYIKTEYEQNNSTTGPNLISGSGIGVEIVNYALQFVGNPYVWGGTDLINGTDCSGFTMRVMEHFGFNIPRTSGEQLHGGTLIGTNIESALPGDLIIYEGHVAIYMGDNKIVHASNKKPYPEGGIKVSNDAGYKPIKGIVRYWS